MNTRFITILLSLLSCTTQVFAQAVPSQDEKFPFLGTFGKSALKEWGDDDFVQTFFFVIPATEKKPVYIRIFDADAAGKNDEVHGGDFNTKMRYTVYGGKGTHSEPDARKQDPVGKYKSGIQLFTRSVSNETALDDTWLTIGPLNPVEGELQPDMGGYVFKIVIEGLEGDDGNMYKLFLSTEANDNKPVEGGNAFAYEYSLRLADSKTSVNHLYPFVASNVVSIKIFVFDYDHDGVLRVISVAKKGEGLESSGNNEWKENFQKVVKEELNTSMDVQFIKKKDSNSNNIVVYITNQYGESLPFFAAPIGGVPKFKYKIKVQKGK